MDNVEKVFTNSSLVILYASLFRLSQDFSTEIKEDPFNIDEIEKLNEMRLRKLEDQAMKKQMQGQDRDVLADFMSNGIGNEVFVEM